MTDTNNTKNTDTTQEDDNSFEKRIQTMSLEQLEEEKKKQSSYSVIGLNIYSPFNEKIKRLNERILEKKKVNEQEQQKLAENENHTFFLKIRIKADNIPGLQQEFDFNKSMMIPEKPSGTSDKPNGTLDKPSTYVTSVNEKLMFLPFKNESTGDDNMVYFNPVVELHKNIIVDIPFGTDKNYVFTQFFNEKYFNTLINRNVNTNSQPINRLIYDANNEGIIKHNIDITLSTLFSYGNILYIKNPGSNKKSPYVVFGCVWDENAFDENEQNIKILDIAKTNMDKINTDKINLAGVVSKNDVLYSDKKDETNGVTSDINNNNNDETKIDDIEHKSEEPNEILKEIAVAVANDVAQKDDTQKNDNNDEQEEKSEDKLLEKIAVAVATRMSQEGDDKSIKNDNQVNEDNLKQIAVAVAQKTGETNNLSEEELRKSIAVAVAKHITHTSVDETKKNDNQVEEDILKKIAVAVTANTDLNKTLISQEEDKKEKNNESIIEVLKKTDETNNLSEEELRKSVAVAVAKYMSQQSVSEPRQNGIQMDEDILKKIAVAVAKHMSTEKENAVEVKKENEETIAVAVAENSDMDLKQTEPETILKENKPDEDETLRKIAVAVANVVPNFKDLQIRPLKDLINNKNIKNDTERIILDSLNGSNKVDNTEKLKKIKKMLEKTTQEYINLKHILHTGEDHINIKQEEIYKNLSEDKKNAYDCAFMLLNIYYEETLEKITELKEKLPKEPKDNYANYFEIIKLTYRCIQILKEYESNLKYLLNPESGNLSVNSENLDTNGKLTIINAFESQKSFSELKNKLLPGKNDISGGDDKKTNTINNITVNKFYPSRPSAPPQTNLVKDNVFVVNVTLTLKPGENMDYKDYPTMLCHGRKENLIRNFKELFGYEYKPDIQNFTVKKGGARKKNKVNKTVKSKSRY